jgi:hypothetical protein
MCDEEEENSRGGKASIYTHCSEHVRPHPSIFAMYPHPRAPGHNMALSIICLDREQNIMSLEGQFWKTPGKQNKHV